MVREPKDARGSRWLTLERPRPDPSAPTPVSPTGHLVYLTVIRAIYYAALPLWIPFWLLQWSSDSRFSSWTLQDLLWAKMTQRWGDLSGWYLPPIANEASRWSIALPHVAPEFIKARQRGEVSIEVIKLRPVRQALRKAIGAAEWIKEHHVPGFWVTPKVSLGNADERAVPREKVILHLHGGGYTGGHPLWMSMTLRVIRRAKCRLLGVNYRKPVSSDAAFPAPLLDALSGYIHLTENLDFPPDSITFFGKSAGGHLCLMLSRYLHELGLAQPGRIIMLAPWCDFTLGSPSYERNKMYDIIGRRSLHTAVRASTRWYRPEALEDRYFSPSKAGAEDWTYLREAGTKVYMIAGTHELFYDEIVAVHQAMKEAEVDVRLREDPRGLHTSVMWNEGPGEVFLKDVAEMMEG